MPFEQAREFLARVMAWPQEGDAPAYVNIHWTFFPQDGNVRTDKSGKQLLPWSGRAVRSLDEAISALAFAMKPGSTTRDIYLCLSTQALAEQKTGRNNSSWFKPIRNQGNVVKLKSIFLDVDFKGGEHGYDTPELAVEALGKFIADSGMPKPTIIVKSGGGLHVYWTIQRALTRDEWQPLAHALAEATKRLGLKCDTQCTIDSARVLRIPDTFNYKADQPRPVTLAGKRLDFDYTEERLWQALEPYKVAVPKAQVPVVFEQPLAPPPAKLAGPVIEKLSAGIGPEYDPVKLDELAKECAFVRDAIATGGLTYSNPMWNLTTLIATFTDDARNDAHRMGNKHPGYSKETTDEFFDRKTREKEEKGLGFPSCATISGSGCTACQSCPHFAAGRSPLAASRKGPPPAPGQPAAVAGPGQHGFGLVAGGVPGAPLVPVNDLPDGYVRDPKGIICVIEHDKSGQQELTSVCDYPIKDGWLQNPPRVLHFTATIDMAAEESIEIDCDAIGSMEMRRILQAQGLMIPVGEKAVQRIGSFLVNWVTKLQQTRDSVKSAPFGWTVENGKTNGFVYDSTVWMKGTTRKAASTSPVLQRQYKPTGDIQPWRDMADLVTSQGRQDLAAILASSFGAPLVRFTGHLGAIMSAYSTESGVGKTTTLMTALSVWGDPVAAKQELDDTQNSVMNRLGQIRSLPLYWDELKTEEDTRKFVKITFQTTSGKEKSRMSRDIKQREPGRWQTLVCCCSNDSLVDHVTKMTQTTTAGLYRIFEYVVKPPAPGASKRDSSEVQIMTSKLYDNYGNAGLEYAKFLGANYDIVEKEMADFMKALGKELQTKEDERFWLAVVAVVVMGAKFANQIGLTKFDVPALKDFMVQQMNTMRGVRDAQPVDMAKHINLSDMLGRFLSAHRARHMLVTNRINIAPGKPVPGTYRTLGDTTKLDAIYVQVGKDDGLLRISASRMAWWLRENGIGKIGFYDKMKQEFGMQTIHGRLGSGTQFAGPTQHLIQIDLAANPLLDFLDQ